LTFDVFRENVKVLEFKLLVIMSTGKNSSVSHNDVNNAATIAVKKSVKVVTNMPVSFSFIVVRKNSINF